MRVIPFAALAALLLLPVATAHVTVTATAPTAPLVVGVPTEIPVMVAASCAAVAAEYQAAGNTAFHFGLGPDTPPSLTGNGTAFEFTATGCDPQPAGDDPSTAAQVRIAGTVRVVASSMAPALTPLRLAVVVLNGEGNPESGEAAVEVQVAPFVNHTLQAGTPVAVGTGHRVPFTVAYQANAATLLAVTATVDGQAIPGPAPQLLPAPYLANKTVGQATFEVLVPEGMDGHLAVATSLVPVVGQAAAAQAGVELLPASHGDGGAHVEDEGQTHASPAAPLSLVVAAFLGLAARRKL